MEDLGMLFKMLPKIQNSKAFNNPKTLDFEAFQN
jgi:hypothetical protein